MSEREGRATTARIVTGRIKVHPDGFAFVTPDDRSEDVHVNARSRGSALDGDRVEVDWAVGHRGLEGRVTKVVERGRTKLTGQIEGSGKTARFVADDARIGGAIRLRGGDGGARPGLAVVAKIVRYPENADEGMDVEVIKILGSLDDVRTEVEKVLACADVEDTFPANVVAEAALVPADVRDHDRIDRADLRHIPFCTIDPVTARDFDDAVAIEALPKGGYRVWVAVADVSHYVREGTAIDIEARRRGCSLYLPNRAIPMLPEVLSSRLCSLVPEEDRLAMVTRIDFDAEGRSRDTDFMAAVIHSRARMDYAGVALALAGDLRGPREKYEPYLPALRTMDAFTRVLRQRRMARGALDLDLPEPVIELDRDDPGLVRDVRRARKDPGERQAYSMIEELMLAANEAVGDSFEARGEPVLWRVHQPPKDEKLAAFADLAQHYGFPFDVEEAKSAKGLGQLLQRLKGHRAEKPLSFQLLRSLKQASYDVNNAGHFGLASKAYIHFTSPIRRYPDVVAHRLLKYRLSEQGKSSGGFAKTPPADMMEKLPETAAETSFAERKAMEIEREVVDLYRSFFMRDRVGDELAGSISAVTNFGLFVTIDEPFVEGLIRSEELGKDYFELDERSMRLVGRRTGRAFALGDRLQVKVLNVSMTKRKIELGLVGAESSTDDAVSDTRQPGRRHNELRGERRREGAKSPRRDRDGKKRDQPAVKVERRDRAPRGKTGEARPTPRNVEKPKSAQRSASKATPVSNKAAPLLGVARKAPMMGAVGSRSTRLGGLRIGVRGNLTKKPSRGKPR